MTSPINEIPQNPHSYQKDNFAFAKVMDPVTTDLQELPADPLLEEGLLPHLVAEYQFARFQDPLLEGPNKFHLPMDTRMFKTYGAEVPIAETIRFKGYPLLKVVNSRLHAAWSFLSRLDHARPELDHSI
jgi:hypothetical protein